MTTVQIKEKVYLSAVGQWWDKGQIVEVSDDILPQILSAGIGDVIEADEPFEPETTELPPAPKVAAKPSSTRNTRRFSR